MPLANIANGRPIWSQGVDMGRMSQAVQRSRHSGVPANTRFLPVISDDEAALALESLPDEFAQSRAAANSSTPALRKSLFHFVDPTPALPAAAIAPDPELTVPTVTVAPVAP